MTALALPGFHPDPSICRVGEQYFLITSSFEYFPGVPIFTSTDLATWTQLGSVLDRPSQLDVRTGIENASGGIYAPALRHHDGRFWMVTTNLHEIRDGHLIVHAEDPAGPWSEPVRTTGLLGIDPDLSWDEDGVCRLTWSDVVNGGISQAVVDPFTGEVLSEPTEIWRGTGGAHAEGPHVFSRGGRWYLVVAEGGTAHGHMVTIARADAPDGPYESNPANPILSHRSTTDPVQSTGHADLVELADGGWAIVHLGTRPRGSFPKWHTNGRETFLSGIDWVDDWPVVVEDRFVPAATAADLDERFSGPSLDPRWIAPGAVPASFASPSAEGLRLLAGRAPQSPAAERLLAVRATEQTWTASVEGEGDLSLTVRIDDEHQAMVERVGGVVRARLVVGPLDQVLEEREDLGALAHLVARADPFGGQPGQRQGPDRIVLGAEGPEGFVELASFDGRYLSTEVAGGFTGRVIGVEALGADALVTRFTLSAA
ncbi:glycoside hydrolase family 43 protein [Rathayibacter sp. VKM Ac-2760]|uniref:glycoside hydrolase family 43 protein n=1 Tax=Rathayibacter sp. VKM Ac-2760 TaxID=2609253 RepID=UPI001317DCB1|nr:glycoside hydrolase family 43 protein [Rathayibacter sp. VKM Ac-2760]QHC58795.1 family 43 glycosylhydrolase [Rathayibacter sp. VKM Ac-2760]